MADVTWLGDEDPSVQAITMYGHRFVKGEPTPVPDKDPRMSKFKGNAFFSIGKSGDVVDGDEEAEIAATKELLDEKGVKYRANASLESLRKLLADATD